MKAQSIGNPSTSLGVNKYTKGFATLEILIAFTILILCISAVIMVTFGNQSIAVDSEISNEAISKAQALLEKARADSRQDFNLVNPYILSETSGPLTFSKKLDVTQSDLFTKKVTSVVTWEIAGKALSTMFTTLLTNTEEENGEDTCSSVLTGDWKNPEIENTINFASISPTGTYILTDVDVYKGKLYVTASKTTSKNDPTLFVFDINDPSSPILLGKLDNDTNVKTSGLNSVTVVGKYAFVASASSYARGQMQVIDLNSMSVVQTFKVPVINPSGSSQGSGNNIFYKNGIIYLGLTKSESENEFNIIDVSDPLNPFQLGKYPIGNTINAIVVRGNYAYIASPNTQELQILDILNINSIEPAGSFNSPNGAGHGKTIYLVGNKLYLGKTTGASFDFHILDNINSENILISLGNIDVGIGNSVNEVIVRDYLSFLLTNKDLEIFDTSDPSNIKTWGTFTLPGTYDSSKPEPSMDCESNRIFISSNNEGGQGSIYIIKPGP